jgi:predicted deacylase
VFNVLQYYDFLEGSPDLESQTRAKRFDQYGSPVGGLVRFQTELGESVTEGQTLFAVTTPFGEQKATVAADTDGILWRARRLPQVATGEYVCSVGTHVDDY